MKYHVTVDFKGKEVRFKNIEAASQEEAETIAIDCVKKITRIAKVEVVLETHHPELDVDDILGFLGLKR